jgi:hypothetical protein
MIFGQDADIQCHLIDVQLVREDEAIFEALLMAGQARYWELIKYWADTAETHKILVLCRTLRLTSKINVLIGIGNDDVDRRRIQAQDAGFTFYTTNANGLTAMVYYRAGT